MAILNNNPLVGASGNQGGYNINNSLRFRSSASAYLNRTPASAGNRKTWTWSVWVKRGVLGATESKLFGASASTTPTYIMFSDNVADALTFAKWNGSSHDFRLTTTQVFRDTSAWYHIVIALDTTQATSTNRIKIYVNGTQVTAFGTATYPSLNYDADVSNNVAHYLGLTSSNTSNPFDGYLTEINFIDGQALTPSSFGETDTITGVWKPKAYSGTYGTNGFYLKFSDIATTSGSNAGLGKDFSGNTNYWTTNNISVTSGVTYDAMTDVPTNTSATTANYATWNPLRCGANMVPTNGNLSGLTTATVAQSVAGTIGISSGKYYWEVTSASGLGYIGIVDGTHEMSTYIGSATYGSGYAYNTSGEKVGPTGGTTAAYGSTFTTNDVIGVALDMDAGTLTFYKNNTSQGTAFTGLTGTWFPATSGNGVAGKGGTLNCGQRPFAYTPPTGYLALNTFNLPNPTILQGNKYMDATLYTGNGTGQTITNAGSFRPDFLWIKVRSNTYDHTLADSVRGVSAFLASNTTAAEGTNSELTSFNSNGFTLGATGSMARNVSGQTYVGWQWQAGQGTNTTNTAGSRTSTVSVNTTAGFSIVNYVGNNTSGATVGHGLGVAPSMIIVKNRDQATAGGDSQSWFVYHRSIGATGQVTLNTTGAVVTNAEYWNNTAPSATVFSLGNGNRTNFTGDDYIAYCWAEIAGFSRFTSYTGNGSADGPFVYLGFRPKWLLIKQTDVSRNWILVDSSRNTFNIVNLPLLPNDAGAEYTSTTTVFDFVSNGFKIRSNHVEANGSGNTYIVAAFAENPFKNSLAR